MAKAISKPLALAVAVGLTLGGSFSAGAPAFAQVDVVEEGNISPEAEADATQSLPGATTIPAGNVFSLTLHKRLNPTSRGTATGEKDDSVSGRPLPGAEFKIEKLQGDVRKQSGFNELARKGNEFNKSRGTAAIPDLDKSFAAKTGVTNQEGELTFNDLDAGAYLVTETKAPAANGAESFITSKPYVVMVPSTNEAGNEWLREVHSYPKNSAVRVDKEVLDAGKHAEDNNRDQGLSQVTYTLSAVVPAVPPSAPEGTKLVDFTIRDSYNNQELRLPENFNPTVERIPAGNGAPQLLGTGSYTITRNAELPTEKTDLPKDANEAFTVTFADPAAAGLEPGDTVRVTVNATMLKAQDQEIENAVNESGIFRGPGTEERFESPNDKVATYIGNIRIIKEDENNTEVKLEGAEFGLANCETPTDYFQTGQTDASGELTFEGIHVSDWANNSAPDKSVEYCLTEIKAPEGYIKTREKPYKIQLNLNSKEFDEGVEGRQTIRRVSLEITNLPDSERPVLPSTGGMGILIVALLGLGIIAGGVYAARRNSANA